MPPKILYPKSKRRKIIKNLKSLEETAEEAVPVAEEAASVAEEAVPVAEETAMVAEKAAPVVEKAAPVAKEVPRESSEASEGESEEDDRTESEEEAEDTTRVTNDDENDGEDDEEDEDNEDDGEDDEEDEDNEDDEARGGGDDSDENSESGDETAVMKPLKMYFQPTDYKKKIRISTRCYVKEFLSTLENLEPPLTRLEKNWFERHPQFKHIFHLPKDNNHKLQGMWMLLLRTACIEKKKEAWFVVNGVPIWYGLREHALISGLKCRNYEANYNLGDLKYVRRHFGRNKVRYEDVKKKLEDGMPADRDRLRMLVLYFLCSIIVAQEKC